MSRILFVLENYLPHIGGVEIVFKNLCEGLAARGHTVTVVTHRLPGTKSEETLAGVRVVRVPCFDNRYLFTFAAIPTVLRLARESDIIHTTTYNGAFPAWVAAKMRHKPALITLHELWIGRWSEFTTFSAPVAFAHDMLERLVYAIPKFDCYVAVSESTRKEFAKRYPKRKSATIYNGFDESFWTQKRTRQALQLRKKLKLEGKYVLFAGGRPGASKGFEYLLQSFTQIQKKIPDAKLLLMLSKEKQYQSKLQQLKAQAGKDVLFVDPVPYAQLPIYRQMADCNVIPSLSEGFGYAVIESAASGKPFVASNVASIPEVAYGACILVAPKDPAAIADAVVKVKRGVYKRIPAKRFLWGKTISLYEGEYRKLLQTK